MFYLRWDILAMSGMRVLGFTKILLLCLKKIFIFTPFDVKHRGAGAQFTVYLAIEWECEV